MGRRAGVAHVAMWALLPPGLCRSMDQEALESMPALQRTRWARRKRGLNVETCSGGWLVVCERNATMLIYAIYSNCASVRLPLCAKWHKCAFSRVFCFFFGPAHAKIDQ